MTKKNNRNTKRKESKDPSRRQEGIPSEYHSLPPYPPSPYMSSMAMIECRDPQSIVHAFGSMQKEMLKTVKEITSKTVEVTKQYVDTNVECLLKQIENIQGVVADLCAILRQLADAAKDSSCVDE